MCVGEVRLFGGRHIKLHLYAFVVGECSFDVLVFYCAIKSTDVICAFSCVGVQFDVAAAPVVIDHFNVAFHFAVVVRIPSGVSVQAQHCAIVITDFSDIGGVKGVLFFVFMDNNKGVGFVLNVDGFFFVLFSQ